MNNTSGVGVLDKAVWVLAAVESGPATLAQLVSATGLAREIRLRFQHRVTDTCWPDLRQPEFLRAIYDFQQRQRNFGS